MAHCGASLLRALAPTALQPRGTESSDPAWRPGEGSRILKPWAGKQKGPRGQLDVDQFLGTAVGAGTRLCEELGRWFCAQAGTPWPGARHCAQRFLPGPDLCPSPCCARPWTPRGAHHFMVSGAPVMNGGGLLTVGSRPCGPVSVQPLLPISGEFSPTQHVLPRCSPAQTDQSCRSVNATSCAGLLVKIAVTCPGAPAWSPATDLGKRWRASQQAAALS